MDSVLLVGEILDDVEVEERRLAVAERHHLSGELLGDGQLRVLFGLREGVEEHDLDVSTRIITIGANDRSLSSSAFGGGSLAPLAIKLAHLVDPVVLKSMI